MQNNKLKEQIMTCYILGNKTPNIDDTAYIAPGATIIGSVVLKENSSVWPGVVLRGDNDPITIGAGSNIQDGSICHTDVGVPLTLGKNVSVGHQAMLHGCTVEDNCLIGIQAVILNNAVIGHDSLVGAGALVTEGKVFPPRSLIIGAPAKAVRTLTDEEVANLKANAQIYIDRAKSFKTDLKPM